MTSLDDDQLTSLVRASLTAQADRLTVAPRPISALRAATNQRPTITRPR